MEWCTQKIINNNSALIVSFQTIALIPSVVAHRSNDVHLSPQDRGKLARKGHKTDRGKRPNIS